MFNGIDKIITLDWLNNSRLILDNNFRLRSLIGKATKHDYGTMLVRIQFRRLLFGNVAQMVERLVEAQEAGSRNSPLPLYNAM